MKTIPMKPSGFAIVDDEDYERFAKYSWWAGGKGHAIRSTNRDGKRSHVSMHREIMGAKKGQMVDHINRNKTDNRRENLRFCTFSQNRGNTNKQPGTLSKYKGAYSLPPDRTKFFSTIIKDGRTYWLGTFNSAEEAARAYDKKAIELYGEFAGLNFPELKDEFMSTFEKEAEEYAHGMAQQLLGRGGKNPWWTVRRDGYLAGVTAEAKKAVEMRARVAELEAAIKHVGTTAEGFELRERLKAAEVFIDAMIEGHEGTQVDFWGSPLGKKTREYFKRYPQKGSDAK